MVDKEDCYRRANDFREAGNHNRSEFKFEFVARKNLANSQNEAVVTVTEAKPNHPDWDNPFPPKISEFCHALFPFLDQPQKGGSLSNVLRLGRYAIVFQARIGTRIAPADQK